MQLKHVISTSQFDRPMLEKLFKLSDTMEKLHKSRKPSKLLAGKIMVTLFYEPSTRTRLSFETAMLKLGGQVISTENAAQFSSAIKGETLEDTIRIVSGYGDVVVMRHSQTGAAKIASGVSPVPFVNAGDGAGEHPTQALLDLYTIQKELGTLKGLTITLAGDLLYGRTAHSLIEFFSRLDGVTLNFVSPNKLRVPQEYLALLKKNSVSYTVTDDLDRTLGTSDVIYMTRVQKERFSSPEEYAKVKKYVINNAALKKMKKKSIIMHPLPRVTELAPEIDSDPRAAYFRQAQNGLYVRMALLKILLQ